MDSITKNLLVINSLLSKSTSRDSSDSVTYCGAAQGSCSGKRCAIGHTTRAALLYRSSVSVGSIYVASRVVQLSANQSITSQSISDDNRAYGPPSSLRRPLLNRDDATRQIEIGSVWSIVDRRLVGVKQWFIILTWWEPIRQNYLWLIAPS